MEGTYPSCLVNIVKEEQMIVLQENVLSYLDEGKYSSTFLTEYEDKKAVLKLYSRHVEPDAVLSEFSFLKYLNGVGGAPQALAVSETPLALIMTPVGQCSLKRALIWWPMDDHQLLQIAINVCQRVLDINKLNVIHNDIKRDNIMVNQHLEVFLIDFGLATFSGDSPGYHKATAGWIAPELAMNGPATAASDAYAVGHLLQNISRHMHERQKMWDIGDKLRRADPQERAGLKDILVELKGWASTFPREKPLDIFEHDCSDPDDPQSKPQIPPQQPLNGWPGSQNVFLCMMSVTSLVLILIAIKFFRRPGKHQPKPTKGAPKFPSRISSVRNIFKNQHLFVQPQVFTIFRSAIEPGVLLCPALPPRQPPHVVYQPLRITNLSTRRDWVRYSLRAMHSAVRWLRQIR